MTKGNKNINNPIRPTRPSLSLDNTGSKEKNDLLFGKKNFIAMGIGIALIFIGYILMSGGSMPSPDVWDESLIYSFRRTVIAPIFILAGFAVQVYVIFARK
jgi:hypothetical protein